MLARIALIVGLLVVGAGVPGAQSGEMLRTSPKHFSGSTGKAVGHGFTVQEPRRRTKEVQTVARGIMTIREEPLNEAATYRQDLTKLCQTGKIRRFGGGVVTLKGRNYSAARPQDIRGQRPQLDGSIYIFRFEGSTACQVYQLDG
jgi:hypothetical protein